jgi:hypothetical protein
MGSFSVKRVGKAALIAVVAAALLGGGKIAYDAFMLNYPMRSQSAMLEERRAHALTVGLVLHPDDLNESRAEGLALYDEFLKFDKFYGSNRDFKAALDSGTATAKVAQIVLEDSQAHDDLMRACSLGNVNVPHDWGLGLAHEAPNLFVFGRYVSTLCALAEYCFTRHEVQRSVEYIAAAARIADSVIDEPNNQAIVMWGSCSQRVIRATYGLLESDPSPATVEAARKLLEMVRPPQDLAIAVRNECLLSQVSARKYDSMTYEQRILLQQAPSSSMIEPPMGDNVSRALESCCLDFWGKAIQNASDPGGDLAKAGQFLDQMCEEWSHNSDETGYLSLGISATFEQVGTGIMRVEQLKRLVLATVDLVSHTLSNSEPPASLAGGRSEFIDPIGHRPFYYRRTDRGFVLQALGEFEGESIAPPESDLQLVRHQGYALTFEMPR